MTGKLEDFEEKFKILQEKLRKSVEEKEDLDKNLEFLNGNYNREKEEKEKVIAEVRVIGVIFE